jgi:hypothetical protein
LFRRPKLTLSYSAEGKEGRKVPVELHKELGKFICGLKATRKRLINPIDNIKIYSNCMGKYGSRKGKTVDTTEL